MNCDNAEDLGYSAQQDVNEEALPPTVQYVIDAGYLIHKVRWSPPTDMRTILSLFRSYMRRFGPDAVVFF